MTRWDLLELKVWTEGFFARTRLDRSVRGWANWIGNGWPDVSFDWMLWIRCMFPPPNPIFPLQQQFPRQYWESPRPPTSGVAYTIEGIDSFRPPHGALIFDLPKDRWGCPTRISRRYFDPRWESREGQWTLPDFTYPPGDRGSTATFDQIKDTLKDADLTLEYRRDFNKSVRNPDRDEHPITRAIESGQGPDGTLID